jgi:hypothetical protein
MKMLTKSKIALVAALLLGSASGAFAQSYDPSVGSGNIVAGQASAVQTVVPNVTRSPLGAYAQIPATFHQAGAQSTSETALFDRIGPE